MAADSKDTAVTDDNTETAVETAPEAAAKASNASAPAKKLSPEALIRSFESAQQKDDLPEIYVATPCELVFASARATRSVFSPTKAW